ncbi:hypothetical protein GGQ88_003506 [Novosphingobium hassiacum]|uniref:Uncharacterized protein n=1 Tax=Novosphingobium hassiacum TaxID=173676 RepID=A0A7W5ZY90_9SPHN|nr:hypothetical protein [Novosphingobium hassiacum]MBB3862208.1 hypothetical protein [Novosphingobium hassiacum]
MNVVIWEKAAQDAQPRELIEAQVQVCPRIGEDMLLLVQGDQFVASVIAVVHGIGDGELNDPTTRIVVRRKDG